MSMPASETNDALNALQLGKATEYPEHYNPALLQPVPRALNREPLGIHAAELPFYGTDTWTAYELSWLNANGLPQVAVAEIDVPVTSPNLIESKSFKLYLNSFNQEQLDTWQTLHDRLTEDLSACAGEPVKVRLFSLRDYALRGLNVPDGESLDALPIRIDTYDYDPNLLTFGSQAEVEETLYSDLLKSNCLITNQPDWGSVTIRYKGRQIDRSSLLRYVVSFRSHNEFHEQCVERIFTDIQRLLKPLELSVEARYTRRGGLDINPIRSTNEDSARMQRTVRQ